MAKKNEVKIPDWLPKYISLEEYRNQKLFWEQWNELQTYKWSLRHIIGVIRIFKEANTIEELRNNMERISDFCYSIFEKHKNI